MSAERHKLAELHTRLKMLFVAIYREVEGERSNAASAFYRFLIANHIHAQDVDLLIGSNLIERNNQLIQKLEDDVNRLARENAHLRRHLPPKLRELDTVGSVDFTRWSDLCDAVISHWGDPLPHDWQHKVAKLLRIQPLTVQQWEDGLAQVPDEVLEKLSNPDLWIVPDRPKRHEPIKRSKQKTITNNQVEMLRGIKDLSFCCIRSLSYHLYGEPDTNENLADAISRMMDLKWVSRKPVTPANRRPGWGNSKWMYYLSDKGTRLLNENSSD